MQRYSIGIDPGLGETGVVLFRDDDESIVLGYATFSSPGTKEAPAARVMALADHVIDLLVQWVGKHEIKLLDIAVEIPFLRGNPQAYAKQMRTVQEFESGIMHRLAGELVECWVTEVSPSQSKTLACNHGGAKKAEIVEASPFGMHLAGSIEVGETRFNNRAVRQSTLEALADAWAHGLATWSVKGGRFNYTALKAATIRRNI